MSSSVRAIGARARQEALRTLPIAAAAFIGTGLLLTACSGSSLSGGGSAASAPHRALVPSARGAANGAAVPGAGAAGSSGKAVYCGGGGAPPRPAHPSINLSAEPPGPGGGRAGQATEGHRFVTPAP